VCDADEPALPMGAGKTSPVSSVDVARAVAAILDDPAQHIGHIYDLTGPESADLDHYARVGRSRSCAISRATPIASPSPTADWSPPTPIPPPSGGRTTASTGPTAGRR